MGWRQRQSSQHHLIYYLFDECPYLLEIEAQKAIALSSSEAEYCAMAEAAKEIRFIVQVLESLNIVVSKPIVVHVDNIGAIFMSENASATSRTRHVDARYHFVREFVEDGFLKIVFVKSQDNKSDIFTKKISSELYSCHVQNYIAARNEFANITLAMTQEGCRNIISSTNTFGNSTSTASRSSMCVTPMYYKYCTDDYKG